MGTEEYVAPEIINNQEATFASDLWSLGIIIYQVFTGKTPFKGFNPAQTFDRILECEYELPDSIPDKAKDLIRSLLKVNPYERLGAENIFENMLENNNMNMD